jgi:undecaprenyl-diphosphatase
MSNLEALLLGIVQGLTEFLPISSSGHLILVPWLQDYTFLIENPEFNKTFDVALHAGTLIAAIAYFRREVVRLIHGFLAAVRRRAIETPDERL